MRILNRQDIGPMNSRRYSKCKSPSRMPLGTDVSEIFNVSTKIIFIFDHYFVSLNGVFWAAWASDIHYLPLTVVADTPPSRNKKFLCRHIIYYRKAWSPNSGQTNNYRFILPFFGYCLSHVWEPPHHEIQLFIIVVVCIYNGKFTVTTLKSHFEKSLEGVQYPKNGRFWPSWRRLIASVLSKFRDHELTSKIDLSNLF